MNNDILIHSKLIQLITAVNNISGGGKDQEYLVVKDTGNGNLVRQFLSYDEGTDTTTVSYQESDGTPYVLVGTASYELYNFSTTGLSTEAKQDTTITALGTLDADKATETKQDSIISELQALLTEATFESTLGEVNATPTANTVLDRLKAIKDSIDSISIGGSLGATSAISTVASTITNNTTLLALDATRVSAKIFNDSTQVLYLAEGSGATPTNYTYQLDPGDFYIVDDYTGIITGVWSAVDGQARITQITP